MPARTTRNFSREGKISQILQEVIDALPKNTQAYMVGGAARNLVYYDTFRKALPQRDYDILIIGDLQKVVSSIRKKKFTYGKIRRKNDIVLKKALIKNPRTQADYVILDLHRTYEKSIIKNLHEGSAFTLNGFAIPLQHYLSKDFQKHVIKLPSAMKDLKSHQLRINHPGYTKHSGNLFACLRFMSLGFKPPTQKEITLLLQMLPKLEAWRFERNVQKVFMYVGGEKKARALAKKIGITIDIFNLKTLRSKIAQD